MLLFTFANLLINFKCRRLKTRQIYTIFQAHFNRPNFNILYGLNKFIFINVPVKIIIPFRRLNSWYKSQMRFLFNKEIAFKTRMVEV